MPEDTFSGGNKSKEEKMSVHPTRAEFDTIIENFIGKRLSGRPKQGIFEQTTAKNYEIGSRLQLPAPNGGVFHYCYADETLDAVWGAFNGSPIYASGGVIAAHLQGATLVNLDCATVVAANALAGGYLANIEPGEEFTCRIKSNLATAAGIIAITLEDPLPLALSASVAATRTNLTTVHGRTIAGYFCHMVRAYPNKYAHLINWGGADSNTCYKTVVAVPLMAIAAERYFWGLTWGEVRMRTYARGDELGRQNEKRLVPLDATGGTVYQGAGFEDVDTHRQAAGYVLYDSWAKDENSEIFKPDSTPDGDQMLVVRLDP